MTYEADHILAVIYTRKQTYKTGLSYATYR